MLSVVLIDDERLALNELEYILNKYEELNIVSKFIDPIDAMEYIKDYKPDLVFLDIEMPELQGIQVAEKIIEYHEDIKIVFVTAFDEYALKAFEVQAVDYLLKPFSEERVHKCVEKIIKNSKDSKNSIKVKDENSVNKKLRKVSVWKDDILVLLEVDDILYCKVKDGELFIYTKKETYKSQYTLSQMENKLQNYEFIKCHRNFIVNLNEIEEIVPWFNGTYILKLNGSSDEIPVSRHYNKLLKNIFNF